jgi:hypothetical protein
MPLQLFSDQSPGLIFITLWKAASKLNGAERLAAAKPNQTFKDEILKSLRLDSTSAAFNALSVAISKIPQDNTRYVGSILYAMQEIDNFFYKIHPRLPILDPTFDSRIKTTTWLEEAKACRAFNGYYAKDGLILIPRGPLQRLQRHPDASSAESLSDRFAALSVVSESFEHDGTEIKINIKHIPINVASGADLKSEKGAEKIAFVPIAEEKEHLKIRQKNKRGVNYVDFRAAETINPSDMMIQYLKDIGPIDLVMAPEFLFSEEQVDSLRSRIPSIHPSPPSMIIAGSGSTKETYKGLPWNESSAISATGAVLWKQRKVWIAGVSQERAEEFDLEKTDSGLIYEENIGANTVIVADTESLGRCVILICQDLEAKPLSDEIVRSYQPDWVFSPIMDKGISTGRWMHVRAFELSRMAQSRFLVVSSTALAKKLDDDLIACGLAVGPQAPSASEEKSRAAITAKVEKSQINRSAVIQWGKGKWEKTTILTIN